MQREYPKMEIYELYFAHKNMLMLELLKVIDALQWRTYIGTLYLNFRVNYINDYLSCRKVKACIMHQNHWHNSFFVWA